MYNSGNSSKNVTGASIVDGTVETVDIADDAVTADKLANTVNTDIATGVSGSTTAGDALPKTGGTMTGTIAGFTSTGIDDNATSTAITIDASENVTVGMGSAGIMEVRHTAGYGGLRLAGAAGGSGAMLMLSNNYNSSIEDKWSINLDGATDDLSFFSGGTPAVGTERLRITEDGQHLIGATSWLGSGTRVGLSIEGAGGGPFVFYCKNLDTGGGANMIQFLDGSGHDCGSIESNATSNTTAYLTSSDYRLKENVSVMSGSVDRLKNLKPCNFNFKTDPDTVWDGFLAHEAQEVVPECASRTKDAMKDEEYEVTPAVMDGDTVVTEAVMGTRSVPDYQGIDQSKLVPLLVSALQEAITRIEQLENN